MGNIRLATIKDVKSLSSIHAKTWKTAYIDYISYEYLEGISEERWVLAFTKNIEENLYEVALYNVHGKNTGCITYGKARGEVTCNTGDNCSSDSKEINCKSDSGKNCCTSNLKDAEIISLYVLPEFWSSKQGYELIKFALDKLKSQGYGKCSLWVIEENERARHFYERVGFVCDSLKTTINLGGQDLTEIKYSIALS